jgi:ribosomal protein S18 acetylase RimI-like enzyme
MYMKVRLAAPKDKMEVLTLLTQLGQIVNANDGYDPKNENALKYGSDNYDRVIDSDSIKIFVIEDNQKIIGMASFYVYIEMITGEKYAHIDDFIIVESKRNQGYGRKLMQEIIKYSKKNKIQEIKLISFPDVKDFYLKCGAKQSEIAMKIDIKINFVHK